MDVKEKVNSESLYSEKIRLIRPKLYSLARSKIFNNLDAEDIVQNTISILIEKQTSYREDGNFWGWAFRILNFQIMRFLTESKRNREDASDYSTDSFAYSLHHIENQMPFDPILKKELHDQQMSILHDIKNSKMPPRERQFFEYQLEGWSKQEIIYAMKLNKDGHFNVLKRRVLQRLIKHSKSYNYDID